MLNETTLDLLVKAGPLGIVVLLVGAFGWFLRWLVTTHQEDRKEDRLSAKQERDFDRAQFLSAIAQQREDGIRYAETQRNTFLEHNANIARNCEASTKAIIDAGMESQRIWMAEWLPKILFRDKT